MVHRNLWIVDEKFIRSRWRFVDMQFIAQESVLWIKQFLERIHVKLELSTIELPELDEKPKELQENIVECIITDAFVGNRKRLEKVVKSIEQAGDIRLGRYEKDRLRRVLDYNLEDDFRRIEAHLQDRIHAVGTNKLTNGFSLKTYIGKHKTSQDAVEEFKQKLEEAIKDGKTKRVFDYVNFLFSRLVAWNEHAERSCHQIFKSNTKFLKKDLSKAEQKQLKKLCHDKGMVSRENAILSFTQHYDSVCFPNEAETYGLIHLDIDQSFFKPYQKKDEAIDEITNIIASMYASIENHKTLTIKISDVVVNNQNIKWELYAKILVFCEKFRHYREERHYYNGGKIARQMIEYNHNIELTDEDEKNINLFLKGKMKFKDVVATSEVLKNKMKKEILTFKNIDIGFSFQDCFILKKEPSERPGITDVVNEYDLLVTFFKNDFEDRKIPCPECGSLEISGNSFPEIGIRSWECKNNLCGSRSKTNRGKRYSRKSNMMQDSLLGSNPNNVIPRELTQKFRKDVVNILDEFDLTRMLVNYYTYEDDKILVVQSNSTAVFERTCEDLKRNFLHLQPEEALEQFQMPRNVDKGMSTSWSNFCESDFMTRIFPHGFCGQPKKQRRTASPMLDTATSDMFLHGHCAEIMAGMAEQSIDHEVTSPPYFNAREYSQWPNLYMYLRDMLLINEQCFRVLKDGGVFFYNIGDTYGNEEIIVNSKMGEKRIPLGAYTILLFLHCGFEILDNIIWDKGETQSNRHKNDGKFTPYYQRPANCYEHMFVFKKPGELRRNENQEENLLDSNIKSFSPVIKIDSKGVNRFGHTAPFPEDIPQLSISYFTNKGEIVLDPFSGSGTTAIVARNMGRKGIGIEMDVNYFELSKRRAGRIDSFSEPIASTLNDNGTHQQKLF